MASNGKNWGGEVTGEVLTKSWKSFVLLSGGLSINSKPHLVARSQNASKEKYSTVGVQRICLSFVLFAQELTASKIPSQFFLLHFRSFSFSFP